MTFGNYENQWFYPYVQGLIVHAISSLLNGDIVHQFLLFWTTGKHFGVGMPVQLKRTQLSYGPPIFRRRFLYRNSEIPFYTTGRAPKRGLFPIC